MKEIWVGKEMKREKGEGNRMVERIVDEENPRFSVGSPHREKTLMLIAHKGKK